MSHVAINPFAETITVAFDPAALDTAGVLALIRGAGLEPRTARMTIPIPDLLHAPAALPRLADAVGRVSDTTRAGGSALAGGLVVEYDAGRVDRESVMRVVRGSGFESGPPLLHETGASAPRRHGGAATALSAAAAVAASAFVAARVLPLPSSAAEWAAAIARPGAFAIVFALTLLAAAPTLPILRRGFRRLFQGRFDENVLTALGLPLLFGATTAAALLTNDLTPLAATAIAAAGLLGVRWLTLRRATRTTADDRQDYPMRAELFALRPGPLAATWRRAGVALPLVGAAAIATAAAVFLLRGSPLDAAIAAAAALLAGFGGALATGTERLLVDSLARLHARGIHVRDAEALERAAAVRKILTDEETFFRPEPEISDYVLLRGETQGGLLRRAAVAFANSEHPLAAAIRAKAGDTTGETPFVLESAEPGRGVTGKVGRRDLVAGIPEYLTAHGVDLSEAAEEIARFHAERKRVVAVALSGRIDGVVAFLEPLREGARTAVETLRAAGIDVVYATTDAESLANAHTAPLAIAGTTILRDRMQRVAVARRLRSEAATAVAIGRSADAAMLRAGDLGIAIGEAPSLLAAADVVVPGGSPVALAQLVAEATAVMSRMKRARRNWLPLQLLAAFAPAAAAIAGFPPFAAAAGVVAALAGAVFVLRSTRLPR